jgi:hypothetical protein
MRRHFEYVAAVMIRQIHAVNACRQLASESNPHAPLPEDLNAGTLKGMGVRH